MNEEQKKKEDKEEKSNSWAINFLADFFNALGDFISEVDWPDHDHHDWD